MWLTAELTRLDRKIDAADTERRRLIDLYQGGFIELPKCSAAPAKSPPAEKSCSTSDPASPTNEPRSPVTNQLRRRVHDFAARIRAVIDTLDNTQKQQLLRLLIEDVRVTGWHVQIRLRIALDPPLTHPTSPTSTPPPHPRPLSSQDGLRSLLTSS